MLHFTPESTCGVTPERWPHGLLLIWEWHIGAEAADGEPERGPIWAWAKCLGGGVNSEPTALLVDGYANPLQVGFALAELINTGSSGRRRIGRWAVLRRWTRRARRGAWRRPRRSEQQDARPCWSHGRAHHPAHHTSPGDDHERPAAAQPLPPQ